MVTSVKALPIKSVPTKTVPTKRAPQKALPRKALSALACCASVSLLLLSSLLVGCVGETVDQQTASDELELAGVAAQQIDQSAVKLETAPGAPGRVVAPGLTLDQVVEPLIVPQLDVVPSTDGTPVPAEEDPKSNAATPDHGGADQMDPEPCPWSQKGPPS